MRRIPLPSGVNNFKAPILRFARRRRRIHDNFAGQLLSLIENDLESTLRARVDPEDVVNSAFRCFFGKDASFANRNAMFVYLLRAALHKLANLRKYHQQKKRDLRREVHIGRRAARDDHPADRAPSSDDILDQGQPVLPVEPIKRPYRPGAGADALEVDSADSFFEDDLLDLMIHGAQPSDAAIFLDQFDILVRHDEKRHSSLHNISLSLLEGRSPAEIATILGVATRTVERKIKVLQEVLEEVKPVTVVIDGVSGDARPTLIGRLDTANDILLRINAPGHSLSRDLQGQTIRTFDGSDFVYPHIAEGDVLRAAKP